MTVFARQADYRFVNMIDRLTSDNYFLGTSLRIPRSGKIRKARGHVGRESFWFPDGKALAGCCCRSEFSRLAPRRDYTPIRYRCHWRWLSAKRKLDITGSRSRSRNRSYIPLPVILSYLSWDPRLLFTNFSRLLFLKRRGIVPLLPTNHWEYHFLRVVDRCPDLEIAIFHIQDFSSRSSARHLHSYLRPYFLLFVRFFNLEKREHKNKYDWMVFIGTAWLTSQLPTARDSLLDLIKRHP